MARIVLAGRSSIPTSDIDAMTAELYSFSKNLISDASGNVSVGSAALFTAAGRTVCTVSGSSSSLLGMGVGGSGVASIYADAGVLLVQHESGALLLGAGGATRVRIETSGSTRPAADNAASLGASSNRWSVVYAGTGAINTSDAREKTEVLALTDAEVAAAKQLAGEIGSFRFLDAVASKGTAARLHIGMTVQRAMEVMQAHGLDPFGYGFICRDSWAAETVPARYEQRATGLQDANGQPLMEQVLVEPAHVIPAGDRYGFRADELLLFIARGFDARLQALEARA